MLTFLSHINFLRYRLFLRLDCALLTVDRALVQEFSRLLGENIRSQMTGREARHWRTALSAWEESEASHRSRKRASKRAHPLWPDIRWPVETILWVQTTKRFYGRGELLPLEIKLLGEGADHAFFLERVLPALEKLGYSAPPREYRTRALWGRFEIAYVYVARGLEWEPLVVDGEVNLRLQPRPNQWLDNWDFFASPQSTLTELHWMRPYVPEENRQRRIAPPTLSDLVMASLERLTALLPHLGGDIENLWQSLTPEEQAFLAQAVAQARAASPPINEVRATRRRFGAPRALQGTQTFPEAIPSTVLPLLELGSIFHIGGYRHFGYGTFRLR